MTDNMRHFRLLLLGAAMAFTVHVIAVYGQEQSPRWRRLAANWPDTTNQVRAMFSTRDELYIGTGGSAAGSARVWRFVRGSWSKYAQFPSLKVVVLQGDRSGNLYVGTGTPHSAEVPTKGQATVWKIDRAGRMRQLRVFPRHDMAYSMAWYGRKLHVGLVAEDLPGRAAIWRFDDPGWTEVAGSGVNRWPAKNTYAGIYELWVHDGRLIAGTFSRTKGHGDVLELTLQGWKNLEAPPSIIALSLASYQQSLIAAFSNSGAHLSNPIFRWRRKDRSWVPLGKAPAEWKGAFIHNHMIVDRQRLYVGVGGKRGTLSLWKYETDRWTKLAGDGLYGSWRDPVVRQGAEWVYRMAIHRGKLYAGLASDRSPFQAQVWELTR